MSLRYLKLLLPGLIVSMLLSGCSTPRRLEITEVAPGIFDGRKPRSKADFEVLRAKGIRTIVSLQTITWNIAPEQKHATQSGIRYINVPIAASPFGPSEQKVQKLFQTLAAQSLHPVYVHCLLGRDRTGVLLALYRVYYQDCDPQVAWDEMIKCGGFRSRWGLVGFKTYYGHHCAKPPWVIADASASGSQLTIGPAPKKANANGHDPKDRDPNNREPIRGNNASSPHSCPHAPRNLHTTLGPTE